MEYLNTNHFTKSAISNVAYNFFFLSLVQLFFFVNGMLKYFATKNWIHNKTARPELTPFHTNLPLEAAQPKKLGLSNKLKAFAVSA